MVHRRGVDDLLFDAPAQLDVKKAIGEDEARLRHLEALLDEWMRCQPHLPRNYDKKMARNFIRGSKFNLDTVKRKFESYFLTKHAFPDFYAGRDPEGDDVAAAIECVNIVRMPRLTDTGERICFMSLANPDPDDFNIVAAMKLFWMLYDLTLTSERPITGEVLVFDCTHFGPEHLVKFLSSNVKHFISIMKNAYAARISQLHVVNCPLIVEKLVSVLRPLVPEKVGKRVTVHKGTESLTKYLRPELLPADIGGNLESLRDYMRAWRGVLVENADWFREQESVKIVGTPPKTIEKISYDVSLEGSFRQLNID